MKKYSGLVLFVVLVFLFTSVVGVLLETHFGKLIYEVYSWIAGLWLSLLIVLVISKKDFGNFINIKNGVKTISNMLGIAILAFSSYLFVSFLKTSIEIQVMSFVVITITISYLFTTSSERLYQFIGID